MYTRFESWLLSNYIFLSLSAQDRLEIQLQILRHLFIYISMLWVWSLMWDLWEWPCGCSEYFFGKL